MTLLILYISKRLVWADNILWGPERLVDSDVEAQELLRESRELPMVTRTFLGLAPESETGWAVWALK